MEQLPSPQIPIRSLIFVEIVALFLALCVHSVVPLHVDELGSQGMSNEGPIEAFRRSIIAQGQGPLYFTLLSVWGSCWGWSPLALRGFSLALLPFTVALLFGVGVRSGWGARASALSLLIIFSSPLWQIYTVMARPYALATFLIALSLSCWTCDLFERRSVRCSALVFLGGAVFLTHYFFIVPFLLSIVFMARYRREQPAVSSLFPMELIAGGCGVLIGMVLVVLPFSSHAARLSELRALPLPSLDFLAMHVDLLPLIPLIPILMAFGLLKGWKLHEVLRHGGIEALAVLSLPFGLALASHFLDATLLLPRYLTIAILPCFLCVGRALSSLDSISRLGAIPLALLQVSIMSNHWLSPWRQSQYNSHDSLVSAPLVQSKEARCPLFAASPFIESIHADQFSNPALASFLRAPISYYVKEPFTLIPLGFQDQDFETRVMRSISDVLSKSGCVRLLLRDIKLHNSKGEIRSSLAVVSEFARKQGATISHHVSSAIGDNFLVLTLHSPPIKAMESSQSGLISQKQEDWELA